MMYLIGLGLCDGTDITLRGKQIVEKATTVYLEGYTSLLQCSHEELEAQLGVSITVLSREDVEQTIEPILERAKTEDIALLVIGDPFGATTHTDLMLRARAMNIAVQVVHNTSILSAVGEAGLELYRFGKTVSIPYWLPGYEPTSFLDGLQQNQSSGLHTLCLLDIKADEKRFMTVAEGMEYLMKGKLPEHVVGIARLGCPDQKIIVGTPDELLAADLGGPPHCILVPGKLSEVEKEMLNITTKKE